MSGGSSRRYPPELRERAVRMVAEISDQHDSEWAAISEVARLLGVGCAETVRKWVRQTQVDAGSRAGTTTEETGELKRQGGLSCRARTRPAVTESRERAGRRRRGQRQRDADGHGHGGHVITSFRITNESDGSSSSLRCAWGASHATPYF